MRWVVSFSITRELGKRSNFHEVSPFLFDMCRIYVRQIGFRKNVGSIFPSLSTPKIYRAYIILIFTVHTPFESVFPQSVSTIGSELSVVDQPSSHQHSRQSHFSVSPSSFTASSSRIWWQRQLLARKVRQQNV